MARILLNGFLEIQAKIVDRQIMLHLEPTRLPPPTHLAQVHPAPAGNQFGTTPVQPVDHIRQAQALIAPRAIEVFVLVKQLQAFFSLALAAEKQAPDLGEAQHAIIGMDGFQDMPVALCKAHIRGIGCPPIARQRFLFFFMGPS